MCNTSDIPPRTRRMGNAVAGSSRRRTGCDHSEFSLHRREERIQRPAAMSGEEHLRLHSRHCDKLYRWSMWRMYINQEMSRTILQNHANEELSRGISRSHESVSAPISEVVSPYLDHPDCSKYGRLMRRMFGPEATFDTVPRCLSDNHYLVYGIPRISLNRKVPKSVSKLYESCDMYEQDTRLNNVEGPTVETYVKCETDGAGESDQISDMFRFIGSVSNVDGEERVPGDRHTTEQSSVDLKVNDPAKRVITRTKYKPSETSIKTNADGNVQSKAFKQDIPPPPPHPPPPPDVRPMLKRGTVGQVEAEHLVSKSRVFWEKLAVKKGEIIQLDKQKNEQKTSTHQMISSDMLMTQRSLLKPRTKTKKRNSKDMWRSLADRRLEIVTMGQQESESHTAGHGGRRQESRTSQLWSFMFSRKRQLAQMKDNKHPDDHAASSHSDTSEHNTSDHNLNVEDNFQRELADKLRKRRSNIRPVSYAE